MASFTAAVLVMGLLLFIRMPWLEQFFLPTLPQVQSPFAKAGDGAAGAPASVPICTSQAYFAAFSS